MKDQNGKEYPYSGDIRKKTSKESFSFGTTKPGETYNRKSKRVGFSSSEKNLDTTPNWV